MLKNCRKLKALKTKDPYGNSRQFGEIFLKKFRQIKKLSRPKIVAPKATLLPAPTEVTQHFWSEDFSRGPKSVGVARRR